MNAIQKYFKYRQSLIDQYVRGDMTKNEYLNGNLDAVLGLNINPFTNIDTVEKGLFNYQYYNALAKEAKIRSYRCIDRDTQKEMIKEANDYYYLKDTATVAVLKLLEFEGVQAYFVKVRSKYLKGKLIEILIEDYGMILHSTSNKILSMLRRENIFQEETKHSLIDGYINQKY